MRRSVGWCVMACLTFGAVAGAETRVATVKPQFLPPADLARVLGIHEREGADLLEWRSGEAMRSVEVRRNDAANLIVISGEAEDVAAAEAMLKAADVAPHQIMISAAIVEVDRDRLTEIGFDWSQISARIGANYRYVSRYRRASGSYDNTYSFEDRIKSTDRQSTVELTGDLFTDFRALERAGAATFRDAPRILTLNNRRATILDGQRVTYITRYSSYTNLFETDTLDAGLTLSVVPSLGESGYLTLDVRAELTSLIREISGSPVKDGQIVENMVIVKDGETVLLGGFQRTVERKNSRRFPLLGRLLPFLFSRETVSQARRESFVAITAKVVDLAAGMDEASRGILDTPPPEIKK